MNISYNAMYLPLIGHRAKPLALVLNFGHEVASLAVVRDLDTIWCQLHCHIAKEVVLCLVVGIETFLGVNRPGLQSSTYSFTMASVQAGKAVFMKLN